MKKILVIDDDVLARWGISKALGHYLSTEITSVATGSDGIQEIAAGHYDLCLLDLSLPDADGLNILHRIKEISPMTKIIIMTCEPIRNEIPNVIKVCAYSVLEKPFDISDLRAIAQEALEGPAGLSHLVERRSERIKVETTIRYTVDFGLEEIEKPTLEGYVVDLSKEGLGMNTRYPLQPGQLLMFNTDANQKTGVVRWVRILDDAYRVGVQFSSN